MFILLTITLFFLELLWETEEPVSFFFNYKQIIISLTINLFCLNKASS